MGVFCNRETRNRWVLSRFLCSRGGVKVEDLPILEHTHMIPYAQFCFFFGFQNSLPNMILSARLTPYSPSATMLVQHVLVLDGGGPDHFERLGSCSGQ